MQDVQFARENAYSLKLVRKMSMSIVFIWVKCILKPYPSHTIQGKVSFDTNVPPVIHVSVYSAMPCMTLQKSHI